MLCNVICDKQKIGLDIKVPFSLDPENFYFVRDTYGGNYLDIQIPVKKTLT